MLLSEKSDNYWIAMSDKAICALIGKFIKHHRLEQNLTQEALAAQCGVHRTTILDIEKGQSASLITIIQVLRILNKLHLFRAFIIQPEISPIMVADALLTNKKRASRGGSKKQPKMGDWT